MVTTKPKIPQLPGGPDPERPVPRVPVAGVDLPSYASISAELAEQACKRATVLARFKLDETSWLEVEKTWLLRLAVAGLQGDVSLQEEHDASFRTTQLALAAASPLVPIEDYARLIAALEEGQEPSLVMAEAKVSVSAFARSHEIWAGRIAADPALAGKFRALVSERRGHNQRTPPR